MNAKIIGPTLLHLQQKGGKGAVEGAGLKHDFYEFDWGGFSIASIGFIPVRIVHVMALVHLQAAEEIISMKGYANIDIISHSWGTTLSYDLMNSTDIEVHDWVTMGSPLKKTTEKPAHNTGKWINCYSLYDPATHFEIFPPYMDWIEMLPYAVEGMRSGRQGRTGDGLTVDRSVDINHDPYDMGQKDFDEHTAYWNWGPCLNDLRNDLQ